MTRPQMKPDDMRARAVWMAATGAGAGYFPRIPGTAGSAVGLALGMLLFRNQAALTLATLAVLLLAFWSAGKAERLAGKKDASQIVIDEIAGMLLCLIGMPLTPFTVPLLFIVFRLMDIIKIFPAGRIQRMRGSFGIVLDDVVAAFYTQVIVRVVIVGFPVLVR